MPDPSQTGRRERTPGRRLHDRLEGSEVSSGSKYYDLMNPADKAGWERLAREIDKEMEGLGLRLNDAERDREKAEKRERALREALERIGYREACSGAEAEELRMLARAALGWECAECKNTGVAEGDQSKPCPRCGGASGMSACVPRSGHALDAALAASPGEPEGEREGRRRPAHGESQLNERGEHRTPTVAGRC